MYYNLEGAGISRRILFHLVSGARGAISRLPPRARHLLADMIAVTVYLPLGLIARRVERLGKDPSRLPLFQYRNRSFSVMRNDALDRFGTRLEQRFSREEMRDLLEAAGLEGITFSDDPPWWVAVGRRSSATAVPMEGARAE